MFPYLDERGRNGKRGGFKGGKSPGGGAASTQGHRGGGRKDGGREHV